MDNNLKHKQQGAALLVLFLVIFTVSSTVLLAGLNNNAPNLQRESNIREEMALAKEALLSYAVNYPALSVYNPTLYPATIFDGRGRFPCTDSIDFIDDGSEECLTLGPARLPDLPSSSPYQLASTYLEIDRKFWYYISPSYVRNAGTVVNSSTVGGYTVDAQSDDIVAVIISPGEALSWQDRLTGASSVSNYLEEDNQAGTAFFNTDPNPNPNNPDKFNDHVLGISHSELMSLITVVVAREIESSLDSYYSTNYWRCSSDIASCNNDATKPYPYNYDYWVYGNSYPRDGNFWYGTTIARTKEQRFDTATNGTAAWFDSDDWDVVTNYTYNSPTNSSFTFDGCSINFSLVVGADVSRDQRSC